ncbi:MAG TPA: metal ABC transporter permease [Phycisphaerae bacterium]|nr:metal ABC transporter permease [Phycisphaerae bacterium]HNU43963.1 metal ABC transporter permease [Phycisphaerae bacterium]
MTWYPLDTGIVLVGALSAVACALLGNFLVLKRISMMGDALSHAVLPGLAIAFLLTGSRGSLTMFIGAAVAGVLTAAISQWVSELGQVEESASLGVVFTALFALGLILIVRGADAVDLDPGCVLYGSLELVPLESWNVAGFPLPRAAAPLAVACVLNLGFLLLFYKELKVSTFDPALAKTLGIPARLLHYVLMTLIAVTTVAAFESVGSILVIAMLIVPPATAHLLTDRLPVMLLLSVVLAMAAAVLGHVAAITVPTWFGYADTSTAGMMAVVAGLLFGLAVLAAPRYGLARRVAQQFAVTLRIAREDALGLLYRIEETQAGVSAAAVPRLLREALGGSSLLNHWALRSLRRAGHITRADAEYRLTDAGRATARTLIRAHRLWESYLTKHLALRPDQVHAPAHRIEHFTTGAMREALAGDVEPATQDPHGRSIPDEPSAGEASAVQ